MSQIISSLYQTYKKQYKIPLLLVLSSVLLAFGLYLPVITLQELIFWKTTFSIVTGVFSLFQEGHYILGAIIFLFSVVFPISKLTVLFVIWFCQLEQQRKAFFIKWLGILGKWSMLDVFVVALTIIVAKISKLAHAEPRIGIYFFGVSIILAMLATEQIDNLLQENPKIPEEKTPATPTP